MWGIGVTSRIAVTSRPAACNERMAASRPAPGPLTQTSIFFMPCSRASRAAACAAICAANGVDFFEPLNPDFPADDQETIFPLVSVIETIVLLKVDLICATPTASTLCPLRFAFVLVCSANYSILIIQLVLLSVLLSFWDLYGSENSSSSSVRGPAARACAAGPGRSRYQSAV